MGPTHIERGALDLVLTDVADFVRGLGWLASGTSEYSAVFMDVVLEQSIPHLMCRQEVYLKNSLYLELIRGDVKRINWNEILKSSCPV